MPSIHDSEAIDRLADDHVINPHRLRRLRNAFYKKGLEHDQALAQLSPKEQKILSELIDFHALRDVARYDSDIDGATKLIFRTARGHLIESVILRIASGRTSLCLSSQVGCAGACRFCASGKLGLVHQLTAAQILDQLILSNLRLQGENRRVRNVVFMGMGEPFHNEKNLYEALQLLHSPSAFDLAPRQITVSTVGIPDAMVRFARHFPQTNLALSLHSARQEIRERLIPLAGKHPLAQLRRALHEVTDLQGKSVMVEYLLLEELTDRDEDLDALSRFLEDLPVHINLLPYNPVAESSGLRGTAPSHRDTFAEALRARGFKVTRRYSLGADIAAACGQLVLRENRKIESR